MSIETKNLFQIGEVSKFSNISIKTLRYYDEIGLLTPDEIDEFTGYRYYSHKQIILILVIKHLKKAGFSLKEIKLLLGREDMNYNKMQIEKKYKEIDDKISELLLLKEKLNYCLNEIDKVKAEKKEGEIEVKYIPETYVVYLREKGNVSPEDFAIKYCKLWSIIEKNNLHAAKNVQALYYNNCIEAENKDLLDIEVCAPVSENREIPGIVRKFGGFKALSVVHYGSYDKLIEFYKKMFDYAEKHGYKVGKPAIDNYIVDIISTSNPDNYITELLLPISEE